MAFDLRTQRLNKKGQIISRNDYTLTITNGVQRFERPKGSGQYFNADGTPFASQKVDKKEEAKKQIEAKKAAAKAAAQKVEEPVVVEEPEVEVEASDEMADLKADLLQDEK